MRRSLLRRNLSLLLNATSQLLLEPKNTDFIVLQAHLPRPERPLANSAGKKKVRRLNFALKYEGKAYAVEGTGLDDHGDAHEEKGFCMAVRKAKVQGSLKGDKFVVTYFELLMP